MTTISQSQWTLLITLVRVGPTFIVSIPCHTLSETLMSLGFLFQVSVQVYRLVLMWHRAFEGGCPSWHQCNPPGIEHWTSRLKVPCTTHCTTATPYVAIIHHICSKYNKRSVKWHSIFLKETVFQICGSLTMLWTGSRILKKMFWQRYWFSWRYITTCGIIFRN